MGFDGDDDIHQLFMAHGLVDTAYFLADLALVFMLTLALARRLELRARFWHG